MKRKPQKETYYIDFRKTNHQQYMAKLCEGYKPKSVLTMSAAETLSFAQRMAMDAVRSCSLTPEEQALYTKCVFDAAQYMQERSGVGGKEFLHKNEEMEMSS